MDEIARAAECDKEYFWRLIKRHRNPNKFNALAIRDNKGNVVHNIEAVLNVWENHLSNLCLPKQDDTYDSVHYSKVRDKVQSWYSDRDSDQFTNERFSEDEVKKAFQKLNSGKAPGYDDISSEHLKYAGNRILKLLAMLYSSIISLEYVPDNCRRGIQVPLYNGKNTDSLDPNNYRGITLLTTYNKILEILLWHRLEVWWYDSGVISGLQGACRKGTSCLHSAMTLQETVATNLDRNKKVFVAYFDVAKAFDTV